MMLANSEACERNKGPILDVLKAVMPNQGRVLEVGSCTGQHVVFFAPEFPGLTWQPSDRAEHLAGLRARLQMEGSNNILPPIELDVLMEWPNQGFVAVYSANTAHIMGWRAVCAMFEGVGLRLEDGGVFCLYGPFNLDGGFTSASNQAFDRQLRKRDPDMGIRDVADIANLAEHHHMKLERNVPLPANNRILIFRKSQDAATQ